jgi:competence/damage-inducible protein CinA-like protein
MSMIKAEIIAVGSELLSPFRMDTNSLFLTQSLEEHGIRVIAKTIIGDDRGQLVNVFKNAFARSDVIIVTGGLGPTVDDLTREALSEFLNIPLEFHPDILEVIRKRFTSRGIKMPEINRKQAMVLRGAKVMENPNGTAPGLFLAVEGKQVFLLPGPPFEMQPMWEKHALQFLTTDHPFERKIFRIAMMPESRVDELLKPVSSSLHDVEYTILAAPAEIEVHLLSPQSAEDEFLQACAEVRAILGNKIYTEDHRSLQLVVGELLKHSGKRIAVAESCTGGLLGHRITDAPGSSTYFERGVVVYSNQAKIELLNVPEEMIVQHGAVSEPVAKAMAEAIRKLAKVDYGISITGIAGPDGGSEEKPVGTVFVGLSDDGATSVERFCFPGNRERIKFMSSQAALNLLRLKLLET